MHRDNLMADAGVALRVRVGSSRVTSCLIINKSLEALVPLSASITYITLILFNRHDCSPLERARKRARRKASSSFRRPRPTQGCYPAPWPRSICGRSSSSFFGTCGLPLVLPLDLRRRRCQMGLGEWELERGTNDGNENVDGRMTRNTFHLPKTDSAPSRSQG